MRVVPCPRTGPMSAAEGGGQRGPPPQGQASDFPGQTQLQAILPAGGVGWGHGVPKGR